ncbi:hypothetical protein COCOBI_pt-2160 (chloroplast) [Coccomyxa sp. Obi]|nr:hypothetical protein COCOBI_pt-2160 [Coccomyxa sp. Obi]
MWQLLRMGWGLDGRPFVGQGRPSSPLGQGPQRPSSPLGQGPQRPSSPLGQGPQRPSRGRDLSPTPQLHSPWPTKASQVFGVSSKGCGGSCPHPNEPPTHAKQLPPSAERVVGAPAPSMATHPTEPPTHAKPLKRCTTHRNDQ